MKLLLILFFAASCGYQIFATVAAREFSRRRPRSLKKEPRFSQVKPVRTPVAETLEAVESFLQARSPTTSHDFYLCSPEEAPTEWTERWPQVTWLRVRADSGQNGKAASLAMAQKYWSGEVFIVSDADMLCRPDYLEAVLGEFEDPEVGVVTSLYRGIGGLSLGSLLESLCILDFASSVLVAERTEGVGFAMGSTMAIRREVLDEIGGFEALVPFLADDFQLGYRAKKAGWKVALAPTVLDTRLDAPSLGQAISHQYRWLVTSRVSRPLGHLAFVVTQGLLWAGLLSFWEPRLSAALLLFWFFLRVTLGGMQSLSLSGVNTGRTLWELVALPLKDILYLPLWAVSLFGNRVLWGEQEIEIDSQGRIA